MKTKLTPKRNGNGEHGCDVVDAKGTTRHSNLKAAVAKTLADQVKEDQITRATACKDELAKVLEKHNCTLRILPAITINGQPLGIDVFAKPPE